MSNSPSQDRRDELALLGASLIGSFLVVGVLFAGVLYALSQISGGSSP
jgi:hypothetical protein